MPTARLSRTRILWIAVLTGIIAYIAARPALEQRLGISLPALPEIEHQESAPQDLGQQDLGQQDRGQQDRGERESDHSASRPDASAPATGTPAQLATDYLQPLAGQSYRSPAGLVYAPGSQQGHRLQHVLEHAHDQPGRPGKHGVFDGTPQQILQVIDEAYRLVTAGRSGSGNRVTSIKQGDRTVHTVDLGRRVGYEGGRDGNRRGRPAARQLRLVLEGDRVITAYPLIP